MKHFKLGLLGILALFLITSCEIDPIDPGTGGGGTGGGGGTSDTAPSLVFTDAAGSLTSDSRVEPGEIFSVTLMATQGAALLNALTVQENGDRLEDFSNRLTIEGTPAPAAAVLIPDGFKESFTWTLTIRAQDTESVSLYTFIVEDTNGMEASVGIEINTERTGSGTVEPELNILGNSNIIVDPEVLTGFPISILAGNANLASIAVTDSDTVLLEPSRLRLGDNPFTENPENLSVDFANGLEEMIFIRSQPDQSIQTYFIIVFDADDNFDIREVTINTFPNGISGNPVSTIEGVLLNRAGPAGTGGLDLDSGAGTGSSDTAAELRDNGIDGSALEINWLQRISGANNTELKQLIPNSNGLSENFNFDSVTTDSQLADVWGNATDLVERNSNMELTTGFVQVGDLYIALRDGKYYMVEITEIFIDPNGNEDFYRMNIKQ